MSYAFMLTLLPSVPFCRPYKAIALHFAARNRPWNPKSPYHELWKANVTQADHIDFKTPRPMNKDIWAEARKRERGFFPWFVYLSSAFIDRFETKSWYPWLKKTIESPEL